MKLLFAALSVYSFVAGSGTALAADRPARAAVSVSQCFKVRRLLRTDSTHYWADWANTCPYTIEAVYVMVGFRDGGNREMGNGVWPMYFVRPGAHRVTRFSAPVADFASVHLHRITTDSAIALVPDTGVRAPAPVEKPDEHRVADTGLGKVLPTEPQALPTEPPAAATRTNF